MARYRQVSSPVGSYYDRLTDQVQVTLWFGAAGYAAYVQSLSVMPVFLALIGIAFYGLRGYAKYVALEIETAARSGLSHHHGPAETASSLRQAWGSVLPPISRGLSKNNAKFWRLMKACSSSCCQRR